MYLLWWIYSIKLKKGKPSGNKAWMRKQQLRFIEAVYQWKWKMPHHWRPLAHERNSILKCKQTYSQWSLRARKIWLHNDEIRGNILQPPHRHLTPAVVSYTKLKKGKASGHKPWMRKQQLRFYWSCSSVVLLNSLLFFYIINRYVKMSLNKWFDIGTVIIINWRDVQTT